MWNLRENQQKNIPHHTTTFVRVCSLSKLQQPWGKVKSTGQQSHSRSQQCQIYWKNKQNSNPVDALATFVCLFSKAFNTAMYGGAWASRGKGRGPPSHRVYAGGLPGRRTGRREQFSEVVGVVRFVRRCRDCSALYCMIIFVRTMMMWCSFKETKE